MYRKSRASLEELGWAFGGADVVRLRSGGDAQRRPRGGGAELRSDYESLERMGETNYISTTAALLSEVLYRQGDLDGAEEHTRISEGLAAQDDVTSQFRWRTVRAKVLAARGDTADAEKLAREAVALIQASDDLNSQGDAALDLAEVLRAAGRLAEAAEAAGDALSLYEAKGNSVSAALARAMLEELGQRQLDNASVRTSPSRCRSRRSRASSIRVGGVVRAGRDAGLRAVGGHGYSDAWTKGRKPRAATERTHPGAPGSCAPTSYAARGARRPGGGDLLPAAGRIPDWTRQVTKEMTAVRDAWDQHIDGTEKPGGLYEEIVGISPRLAGTVDRLRMSIPDITGAVGQTLARLEQVEIRLAWPLEDARDDLQRLIGRAIRHRQKGADLVWEAYNVDIGGPE